MLHSSPSRWMSEEALESGVLESLFALLRSRSSKFQRRVMCDILKELLLDKSSMSERLSVCLLKWVCFVSCQTDLSEIVWDRMTQSTERRENGC